MRKIDETRNRMHAVEILAVLKETHTYEELSDELDLPVPVLSRYVNGHVLPKAERAREIIEYFTVEHLRDIVKEKMLLKEDGAFDISPVVFDTKLLRVVGRSAPQLLEFADIEKIVTPAADGIPLAVQIGNVLDVDVVIAKGRKEIGVDEFYEERASYVPSVVKDFYVPKTALRRGDLVLLVDDFIRTGVTLRALVRLVNSAMGSVVGIFALVSIGEIDSLLETQLDLGCPVHSLITISE